MTLIDLTNVRDLAVIIPRTGTSDSASSAGCIDGACHAAPPEPSAAPQERARG